MGRRTATDTVAEMTFERSSATVGEYLVSIHQWLPDTLDGYAEHASFSDTADLQADGGSTALITVARRTGWPEFVALLRSGFHGPMFSPGVALVPETGVLFIGGGQVVRAYSLRDPMRRLWEEEVAFGFWDWRRFDDVVVMSGEVTIAAWTTSGERLWSSWVEPPWEYEVSGDRVSLDSDDRTSRFELHAGPG